MKLKKSEILVLRDVKSDMTSRRGFLWPTSGYVEAPDWRDDDLCGGGLHGLPWGAGGNYFIGGDDAKYLVVRVDTSKAYQYGTGKMTDKCKFRSGHVVFCGSRSNAVAMITKYAPVHTHINYSTQTAGDRSTQTAGNYSTQTAGDESTQTAGYRSNQTAGDESTQTAGEDSTQTAGNYSTQTAGYRSTQTAGNYSTQTAGERSTQKAGERSTQMAGYESTQTAGVGSVQIIRYYYNGYKIKTRSITEKEANIPYKFSDGDWHEITA